MHFLMPDQVEMDMKHFLSTFFPDVELELVADKRSLLRNFFGSNDEMPEERLLCLCRIGNRRDVFAWNDQQVRFVFWVDVVKRDTLFIFVDEVCGNLLGDDVAEETVGHWWRFMDCLWLGMYSILF